MVKSEEITGILDRLSRLPVLAIDTETTGLKWDDRAFSIQIAAEDCAFYFDARIVGWSGLDRVRNFLNEYTGTLVFKNAKFDLHKAKLDPRATVADIEVLERLINNTFMSYRLADQAKRYGLEKHDTVAEYVKKHGIENWMDVPIEIMAPYATNDAEITYKIYMGLIPNLDPRSLPVWENECALTKVCARIEERGIRIDNEVTHKALTYERGVVENLHKEFKNITGKEFSNSKSLLVDVFLAGGDELPLTEKGNYKLDDDTLSSLSSPAARVVQEIRHYEKRISTYYSNFINLQDKAGFIHADIRQAGTATGRISYRDPNFQNCLSMDTEVLTKYGWVKGSEYSGDEVLAFRDGHLFWEKPSRVIRQLYSGAMVSVKNQHMDMLMTEDHRVLYQSRKNKQYRVVPAKFFPKDALVIHAGHLGPGDDCDGLRLMLDCAVQADGHINSSGGVDFSFKKLRKALRLVSILKGLEIKYTYNYRSGRHRFYIGDKQYVPMFICASKKFVASKLLSLSLAHRLAFVGELKHWDGLSTRHDDLLICSKYKHNVDVAQAVAATCGFRVHISKMKNKNAWCAYITNKDSSGTATANVTLKQDTCEVWCLTVSSGAFLVRRGSDTFITGNCPKEDEESDQSKPFVVRQCLVPRPGHSFISLDYSQQEYRLMLAYANESRLIEQVMAGVDLHKATGDMVGIDRKPAKTLNFAVLYGAGRQEIARLLNTDIGTASRLKDKYFMRLPKVERFIDQVISTARDRGFIYNWLGRKLTCPGREYAYKMPNWLIQGGGADICKRAMVELKDYPIVLQVHDQLVLEVPHKDVRSVARVAQEKMSEVFPEKNGMKMAVDVRVSAKSFAERDMEDLCLEEK